MHLCFFIANYMCVHYHRGAARRCNVNIMILQVFSVSVFLWCYLGTFKRGASPLLMGSIGWAAGTFEADTSADAHTGDSGEKALAPGLQEMTGTAQRKVQRASPQLTDPSQGIAALKEAAASLFAYVMPVQPAGAATIGQLHQQLPTSPSASPLSQPLCMTNEQDGPRFSEYSSFKGMSKFSDFKGFADFKGFSGTAPHMAA